MMRLLVGSVFLVVETARKGKMITHSGRAFSLFKKNDIIIV